MIWSNEEKIKLELVHISCLNMSEGELNNNWGQKECMEQTVHHSLSENWRPNWEENQCWKRDEFLSITSKYLIQLFIPVTFSSLFCLFSNLSRSFMHSYTSQSIETRQQHTLFPLVYTLHHSLQTQQPKNPLTCI